MIDFSRIRVTDLIVHDIPIDSSPVFSNVESVLSDDLALFVKHRLVGALVRHAFRVQFLDETTHITSNALAAMLQDDKTLVEHSQQLARHLHGAQNRSNSAGLLMVGLTERDGFRGVALVKMERDQGVRLQPIDREGRVTFDLEHLKDLMLTEATKLYKVAYFETPPTDDAVWTGYVADVQRHSSASNPHSSKFFLKTFLGCRLASDPAATTETFFNAAVTYFNAELESGEQKTTAMIALQAELSSNRPMVNPRQFANDNLDGGHRQAFLDALQREGVETSYAFQKDPAMVQKRLAKTRVTLSSGVQIIGPTEAIDARVDLTTAADGDELVTIADRVKGVGGG